MKDFNVYRLFYPRRKVKLSNPVLVCLDGIWICGPKDLMLLNGNIVFASEHLVFNHLSNDVILHLIKQIFKYDLSLQLVRTSCAKNSKSPVCEYINIISTFTNMRGHGLFWDKQMTYVSIEKKIYMKLTFPSTRSKIGSKIIGVMTMVKRFRTLNTRLRMFRHPFLDGRRSDGADAMTVYRDTLKFDQRMLTLKKSPRSACPHMEFLSVLYLLFSYLRRGWKLSVVVLGMFIIQTMWLKCHM